MGVDADREHQHHQQERGGLLCKNRRYSRKKVLLGLTALGVAVLLLVSGIVLLVIFETPMGREYLCLKHNHLHKLNGNIQHGTLLNGNVILL